VGNNAGQEVVLATIGDRCHAAYIAPLTHGTEVAQDRKYQDCSLRNRTFAGKARSLDSHCFAIVAPCSLRHAELPNRKSTADSLRIWNVRGILTMLTRCGFEVNVLWDDCLPCTVMLYYRSNHHARSVCHMLVSHNRIVDFFVVIPRSSTPSTTAEAIAFPERSRPPTIHTPHLQHHPRHSAGTVIKLKSHRTCLLTCPLRRCIHVRGPSSHVFFLFLIISNSPHLATPLQIHHHQQLPHVSTQNGSSR
jgi:hypothetical protein